MRTAEAGLTEQQVAQYWEDGYIIIEDVLTPDEVETLRQASLEVIANIAEDQYRTKTVHSLGLTRMHNAFWELAVHPKIVSYIVPLLGPDIQLQHSKLATKPPTKGVGPFPWHQDFPFYPHTNTDLLSVMVMLDDATPENGCMYMVKGSHRLGPLNHLRDGVFSAACQEPRHWEEHPDRVAAVTPRTGGISIHHTLTLHGSPANQSDKDRRGIVYSYRADDAYQLGDSVFDDTGLMICGTRKELVRCGALTTALPKRWKQDPVYPFGTVWNQVGSAVTDYR